MRTLNLSPSGCGKYLFLLQISSVALSVASHAIVFLLIFYHILVMPEGVRPFIPTLLLITTISCGASAFLLGIPRTWRVPFLCVSLTCSLIVCFPVGQPVDVKELILIPLLIEVGAFSHLPLSAVLCFSAILSSCALQLLGLSFSGRIEASQLQNVVSFAILSFAASALAIMAQKMGDHLRSAVNELERQEEVVNKLMEAMIGFQEHAVHESERSRQYERKRITREIHDIIGYTLTNTMMMLKACMLLAPEHAKDLVLHLGKTLDQAQAGLIESRKSLRELHNIEDGEVLSLLKGVSKLAGSLEDATGTKVRVEHGNFCEHYTDEIDTFIYHFVQEGLTNAYRHGKATNIRVLLWQTDAGLFASVSDNGKGASEVKQGIGIAGMAEQAAALGGRITPVPTIHGFELQAWLPWVVKDDL